MKFFRNTTIEMYSLVGTTIYQKTTEELENEGFLVPTKVFFINMHNEAKEAQDYNEEYEQFVVNNEDRNNMIVELCKKYGKTKKILVITRRIKHAKLLHEKIDNSIVITGSTERQIRKDGFKDFKINNNIVLIGSAQIFSTGIDVPNLDIIINATGHKSSVQSIQVVGRVKRKIEGKEFGYFIDFDDKTKYLLNASRERKKILSKFGNKIEEVNEYSQIDIK